MAFTVFGFEIKSVYLGSIPAKTTTDSILFLLMFNYAKFSRNTCISQVT